MITDIIGQCRICNQKHFLHVSDETSKHMEKNFKISVYNTICNSCMEKVASLPLKQLISNISKENNFLIFREKREIILVDASTNTETNIANENKTAPLANPSKKKENSKKIPSITNNNNYCVGKTQRSLICEFCKKTFTHTGDLNKHRRKHTGEKPYDCSICKRKFSHASNLVRHQRIHSGEKPFSCPLKCGRNFTRKDKLSEHVSKYHSSTKKQTH